MTHKEKAMVEVESAIGETKSLYGKIEDGTIKMDKALPLNYANRTRAIEIGHMSRLAILMD